MYHSSEMMINKRMLADEKDYACGEQNRECSQTKERLDDRRLVLSMQYTRRKTERFVLQERSRQPLDNKFEKHITRHIGKLSNHDKNVMIMRKSGFRQSLGGGNKNDWEDLSKLSKKNVKLCMPDKVIEYDEQAAMRIYRHIISDESKALCDENKKKDLINKIRDEKSYLQQVKAEGPYTRPFTAITSSRPVTGKATHDHTIRLPSARITSHYKPSEASDANMKTEQSPLKTTEDRQPASQWSDRLYSAKIGSGKYSCSRMRESSSALPIDKYSDFSGLYVSKMNVMNTRTDNLPYSDILLTSSQVVKNMVSNQVENISSRARPRSSWLQKKIIDPKDKWPEIPKEVKFSDIEMNNAEVVLSEIDKFDQNLQPEEHDRRIKFRKQFSMAKSSDPNINDVATGRLTKVHRPLVYRKQNPTNLGPKDNKSSKIDSKSLQSVVMSETLQSPN